MSITAVKIQGEPAVAGPAILRPACSRCPVPDAALCRQLPPDFFPGGVHCRHHPAGTALFRQEEPFDAVLFVQTGWVQVQKLYEDGRRQIVRFALAGDLLGFEGDGAAGMAYSAEAITDVTVCALQRRFFHQACARSARLALGLAGLSQREALAAWGHLCALGRHGAQGRIACLLLDLHHRLAVQDAADATVVRIPLTQGHIADATGLTSVHVCRTLKRMRQDRLLDFHKGKLILLDLERLTAIAQPDDHASHPAAPPPLTPCPILPF